MNEWNGNLIKNNYNKQSVPSMLIERLLIKIYEDDDFNKKMKKNNNKERKNK